MAELTSANATLSEREELSPLLEWVPTVILSVLAHMPGVQNECCHFEVEKLSACRDQEGRLRWNVGEFFFLPWKNIRHLWGTQNGRLIQCLSVTHTHKQFHSRENERWISYSRWMLITVFYGGNAITRYCFLSQEPCKFMRLEIWNNEAWHGVSVPFTHLPLSETMGQINFLSIFPPDCVRDEALTNKPAPSSLHLILRLCSES